MKKRILSILIALAMVLTLMPEVAFATDEHEHSYTDGLCSCGEHNGEHTSWINWGDGSEEKTSLPTTNGNYYLSYDVTLSSTWNVPNGETNLCLNGHTINANGNNFSVITVGNDATLNLYDCNTSTSHAGYVDLNGLWQIGTGDGTEKTITGGIITGATDIAGVKVSGGIFNMYGGTIAGNNGGYGGGVLVNLGSFVMNGGFISNNTSSNGAGVSIDTSFTMKGGKISDNIATNYGGGVYNKGTFNMEGGEIKNNNATEKGGGVLVHTPGNFTMSNGTIVGNDSYSGGGVAILEENALFTMNGGTISGNTAIYSGGVLASSGKFDMSGGTISLNKANIQSGGVGVDSCTFTMIGGEICDNTAANYGGVGVKGPVILGGTAKIKGNVKGGTINDGVLSGGTSENVYLDNGKTITIVQNENAPKEGMAVGVTKGYDNGLGAFTGLDVAQGTEAYFTSDNPNYCVVYQDDILKLSAEYPLLVGEMAVTLANKDDVLGDADEGASVTYDSTTHTLTLNNASIERTVGIAGEDRHRAIEFNEDLTINLIGNNKIGGVVADEHREDISYYEYTEGIYSVNHDVTFTGSGNLQIYDTTDGIHAHNVTFAESFTGTLTVFDGGGLDLPQPPCAIHANSNAAIYGGKFNLTSINDHGIYAGEALEIKNADVKISAGKIGIYADKDITIEDSEVDVTAVGGGISSSDTNVSIKNSTVAVVSGETGIAADMDVSINNSTVKVKVDSSRDAIEAWGNINIDEALEMINGKIEVRSIKLVSANANDGYVTIQPKSDPEPTPSGGGSSATVIIPVSGDANSVKVEVTVSGSTATVKPIKDADLAKVAGGSVEIDLSGLKQNVDTAKIPTETVEKIAEKSAMTVKLPVATVEFDKTATEEIANQAKGTNIELVVDDIKEVSLNAVQKEAVGKLDTAIIIDAHLASGGSKLCTEKDGGFGGGTAKLILPYEIKNNRTAANYSVYYVNDAGKLEKLVSKYDNNLKAFVFEIEHFSVYVVAYDENAVSFVDVKESEYYFDSVKWAVANGITTGTDATHFSPNGTTTRGQMITFLWRMAGSPVFEDDGIKFTDIKESDYFYNAVVWGWNIGIVSGKSETSFAPDDKVTRGEAVTFIYRYAKVAGGDLPNPFTDVKLGDFYYYPVLWTANNEITSGTSATTFSPADNCTRGQIVTFLYRYNSQYGIEK